MYSLPPFSAAIDVLHAVVTGLLSIFDPVLGPASATAAIVALVAAVRTLLIPLGYAQVRAERIKTRLAPMIRDIEEKHRDDRERKRREYGALYAREKTTPLAGVLPLLAQAPVFSVLYGLFLVRRINGEPNRLLDEQLAGVPFGARLADVSTEPAVLVFATLLGLLALMAWAGRRTKPTVDAPNVDLIGWLPFGTLLVAAVAPLSAGIYLFASTAWTVAEREALRRALARREGEPLE